MMSKPILSKQTCQRWIKALRSGDYQQGQGHLKQGNQHGTRFCCLGVLHEISDYPANKANNELEPGQGLPGNIMFTLIKYNDNDDRDFDMIADHIERHLLPKCPEKEVDKKRVF